MSASKQPIELIQLDAKVIVERGKPTLVLDSSDSAATHVTEAARAFFDVGIRRGAHPSGPPPAVFRDRETNLLRIAHEEAIVRFAPGTYAKHDQILKRHGLRKLRETKTVKDQFVVHDPSRRCAGVALVDASNDLSNLPEVIFAIPDFVSQFERWTIPAVHPEQWHLGAIGAPAAWPLSMGEGIVVAVLDDGVDVDHPYLRDAIHRPESGDSRDIRGRDFFIPDDDDAEHFKPIPKGFAYPYDHLRGNDIHGTPCAGLVAARGPAPGVAPRSMILPVKIFHGEAMVIESRVAAAIRYAAANADILSCSWGSPRTPNIELALDDAQALGRRRMGVAIFCGAGNGNGGAVRFPASHPRAIAVGAVTDTGALAAYSDLGPELALLAPSSGGSRGVFTTDVSTPPGRGYNPGRAELGGADGLHTNNFGGTSAAAAIAAGVGALVLATKPEFRPAELKSVLTTTARKTGVVPNLSDVGIVDAEAAMSEVRRAK